MYIYIYIEREREREREIYFGAAATAAICGGARWPRPAAATASAAICSFTPNLPTNIVDFGGFDSSIMLFLRGGILMSIGNFPESLTQAILVGVMLIGRLGVVYYNML